MATPQTPWKINQEEIDKILSTPLLLPSFADKVFATECEYIEEGIRRALGFWVSELEPELMFRLGKSRPYGVTAKGHRTPYIEFEWDDNFYLTGKPETYPIRLYR